MKESFKVGVWNKDKQKWVEEVFYSYHPNGSGFWITPSISKYTKINTNKCDTLKYIKKIVEGMERDDVHLSIDILGNLSKLMYTVADEKEVDKILEKAVKKRIKNDIC